MAPSAPGHEAEARRARDLSALVDLTGSLATQHDIHNILFTVVSRLAELLHVDRGSIVLVDDERKSATVVASSDDEQVRDLAISLDKYPELSQVLETGEPLVIHDVQSSSVLSDVLRAEGSLGFASMALVPIVGEDGPHAVLALRGRTHVRFTDFDLLEARAVANATAIALNNAKILGVLRAESRKARAEERKKLQELSRYFDFFESSADAILVMDRSGRLLFANPTLARLTGTSPAELTQRSFLGLLHEDSRARGAQVIRGFTHLEFPVGIELSLPGPNGLFWVSASFSSVLRESDAILASLRDVTSERALAQELARTKEFLERVIEASVDGIVSADLRGDVLLFNRAAVRLFGYEKREVFGKVNVEELYPTGVARELMHKIRSPEYGGIGRLEDYRVEMLTKHGERVPVSLSASFVMDGHRPVATLGIFTDIREKLHMEERLQKAQEELRQHEKLAAVAALAGTAAHELNQPLTSIMGYAEYLNRGLVNDATLHRAVQVVQSEAERMAEIVRKVGRITRFETKEYVGNAQILDLDRASTPADENDESPPQGVGLD